MAKQVSSKHTDVSETSRDTRQRNTGYVVDAIVIACFFASGFLALTYEVCWIRKSSLVFGAASFALSTVLAVFFGGLAIGSFVFGRYCRQIQRPIALYGLLEFAVGILAILTPWFFSLSDHVYSWLYPSVQENFALLSLTRLLLVTLIILPPTILMGATFPLFCRQYVIRQQRISSSVGWLYGINTFGAAAGAAVCGFWLIPTIGVNTSIWAAGVLNIIIGAVVWSVLAKDKVFDVAQQDRTAAQSYIKSGTLASPMTYGQRLAVYGLFFLAGFAALGNEVLWTRHLSLIVENSVYTYTTTLTLMLIGMVFGSIIAATFFDRIRYRAMTFGLVQALSGLAVLVALLIPQSWWGDWIDSKDFQLMFRACAVILLIPAVLSGAAFPLAIRMVVEDPREAGASVGRMTAVNTLGGIVGSLLVGFFMMPVLGIQTTLYVVTGVSVVSGAIAWLLLERQRMLLLRAGMAAVACILWFWIPQQLKTQLPGDFLSSNGVLLEYREGLASNMAVIYSGQSRQLEINRLPQGFDHKNHQIMVAHVPSLLHPGPESVLVIGLGVGQTASRFLLHDVERLDVAEIESGMKDLVSRHFDSEWMNDERVTFIFDDGRNYVTHAAQSYDLISVEVGQVFRPGLMGFYTVEFYRGASRRLNKNGLICQFMPIDFFNPTEFRTLIRTFREVFPNCLLWFNTSELLLIGSNGDRSLEFTKQQLEMLSGDEALREDLDFAYYGIARHKLNQINTFLAGFLVGPDGLEKMSQGGQIYSDEVPYLEYKLPPKDPQPHLEILKLVGNHMGQPVTEIVSAAASAELTDECELIRRENLKKIGANVYASIAVGANQARKHRIAIKQCQKALALVSDFPPAHHQLAKALQGLGRVEDAMEHLQNALHSDPENVMVHNDLAYLLRALRRHDEALEHFRTALGLYADTRGGLNGAARILATHPDESKRKPQEALVMAKKATELSRRQNVIILDTLAMALASAGEFQQAVKVQDECLGILRSAEMVNSKLLQRLESRRQLYLEERPFIDTGK